ncbi:MAG: DUF4855 domain-containing protein [Victivallaceae bacterium]|nr:DUF4855 domain-containing protein [Victivallaceae bacterium]
MKKLAAGILTVLTALSLTAGFPTVDEAGFRHCALIYLSAPKSAEDFKPMLVKYEDGRPTAQRGFDAFLLLAYTFQSGGHAELGTSTKADWEFILNGFFGEKGYAEALSTAADELDIKEPVKVIVSLSWLNPEVTDFGDVDGDGKSEDLSTATGRAAVLNWFMDRTEAALTNYPGLELWGYYMMREGLGGATQPIAEQYCRTVHDRGLKCLWIPYYMAGGYELAKGAGFDVVLMQSNWIFTTHEQSGDSRRNRLIHTADLAAEQGFGVELELYSTSPTPRQRQIFLESLETAGKMGFQSAPNAYYFGDCWGIDASEDPADRALYSEWMDYIAGKPVTAPVNGTWTVEYQTDASTITFRFNRPETAYIVDIFLEETADDFFTGSVQVESHGKPLAWAIRPGINPANGKRQNISLELPPETTDELTVVMRPETPGKKPNITGVAVEPIDERSCKITKSFGKPYSLAPSDGIVRYPDESGRDLLDGVKRGPWEVYVGWRRSPRPLSIIFDLGFKQPVDDIRLYIEDDRKSAIAPPAQLSVAVSDNAPALTGGIGRMPFDTAPRLFSDFKYNAARKELRCKLPEETAGRYVSLMVTPDLWFFLSEVELSYKRAPIPPYMIEYSCTVQPTADVGEQQPRYTDDAKMLTDGVFSTVYHTGSVGFREEKVLTIDLGDPKTVISSVTVHSLTGGHSNIARLKSIKVDLSTDGQVWREAAAVSSSPDTARGVVEYLKETLDFTPCAARFVRLTLTPTPDWWGFISEITVE